MPEVSIITPVFNGEPYLEMTLESARNQTFSDWEMLLTDDGSTDNSPAIIERYAAEDSRFRLLRNSLGKGPASARNNSIREARGSYLAFLDSDDLWHPTKLAKQLEFMKARNSSFSYTAYEHVDADGEYLKDIAIPEEVSYEQLLKKNVIATATVMVHRERFTDLVMPDYPRAQDFALWLKLLREAGVAHGFQEKVAGYRVTPNTGNRKKVYALKYLFEIYTREEGLSPLRAFGLIVQMLIYRTAKYRNTH